MCVVPAGDLVSLSVSFVFPALSKCIFLWDGFQIPGTVRFYFTTWAGVALIFFPVAGEGLLWDCPQHRLITQRCVCCCWVGLTQSQDFSCLSSSPPGRGWECLENWEGTARTGNPDWPKGAGGGRRKGECLEWCSSGLESPQVTYTWWSLSFLTIIFTCSIIIINTLSFHFPSARTSKNSWRSLTASPTWAWQCTGLGGHSCWMSWISRNSSWDHLRWTLVLDNCAMWAKCIISGIE